MPDVTENKPEPTIHEEIAAAPEAVKQETLAERYRRLGKLGRDRYLLRKTREEFAAEEGRIREFLVLEAYKTGDQEEVVRLEMMMALRDINEAVNVAMVLMKNQIGHEGKLERITIIAELVKQKLSILKTVSDYQDIVAERKKTVVKDAKDAVKPRPMPMPMPGATPNGGGIARGGLAGTFSARRPEE